MKPFIIFLISALPSFAAANLAMASATLAADGVTFTLPISGGACPAGTLSPASGITGFTVTVAGGWTGSNSSVTRSGCTVTLIVSEPVSVDETPTISLATVGAGSNLTDSSANTPTGQSGFGVSNQSEWHGVNGSSMSGKYQAEGAGGMDTNYLFQLNGLSADFCYRINATVTQLDLFAYNNYNIWQIRQDGVPILTYTQSTANTFSEQGLITGLSGAHEYDFCQNNPQQQAFFYAVLVRVRITGTVGAQPTLRSLITAGGDSVTSLGGPQSLTDSTLGDLYQVATATGVSDQYWGSAGDTMAAMASQIPTALSYITGSWPVMFCCGSTGYNDVVTGATASQVGSYVNTFLTNMDNLSNPPTHIVVEGMLPFVSPVDPSFDVAIAAAVATHPRACFAERLDWIDTVAYTGTTGDRQSDQVHIHGSSSTPPLLGYAKLANRETPIAAGYASGSFTLSGSSSGTVGTLIPFSIVPTGGWSWDGKEALTITSSISGDYVCIGTTCSMTTVTVTPALNATPNISIRPSTTGARTLTSSGLPNCWASPSPTSITVAAGETASSPPIF